MTVNYAYDPDAASKADDVASRIDQNGAFIGEFKVVHAIVSERTGTEGIHFEFNSPGGGSAGFDVYTRKADGTPTFGMNQIQAMMTILGLKGLTAQQGKYEAFDFDEGKRVEREGEIFPQLMNRQIGLVLQRENYTKQNGQDGYRMNLFGIFHPDSRLTASELKEGKVKGEKLEKMLRGLKTKDSRTNKSGPAEPAQPAVGAPTGEF